MPRKRRCPVQIHSQASARRGDIPSWRKHQVASSGCTVSNAFARSRVTMMCPSWWKALSRR
eukprot:10993667-Heterocapsa_arctica.AAC.1